MRKCCSNARPTGHEKKPNKLTLINGVWCIHGGRQHDEIIDHKWSGPAKIAREILCGRLDTKIAPFQLQKQNVTHTFTAIPYEMNYLHFRCARMSRPSSWSPHKTRHVSSKHASMCSECARAKQSGTVLLILLLFQYRLCLAQFNFWRWWINKLVKSFRISRAWAYCRVSCVCGWPADGDGIHNHVLNAQDAYRNPWNRITVYVFVSWYWIRLNATECWVEVEWWQKVCDWKLLNDELWTSMNRVS